MNSWCFIRALRSTSITQRQGGTLRRAALLCNNSRLFPVFVPVWLTFIGGDDHVDGGILMRKAFGWRVSSRVPLEVKDLREELILNCFWVLFSDLQIQQMQPSSQQDNTVCVVYPLSHSRCVNQKPQWVEGLREMDIDVMWMRIFLLCALSCIIPVRLCAPFHGRNRIK